MKQTRRNFLRAVSLLAAGSMMPLPSSAFGLGGKKIRVALVGTGVRGINFWGKRLVDTYPDLIDYVGLSDINPGRLAYGKTYMGVDCPVFLDFTTMIKNTKPHLVIVCTTDATHHEYIIKGLEMNCDVLTEKPLTIDEVKCQQIVDAERKSNKNLIVGFNYRWSPYTTKIKELLAEGAIGEVTSVDFNWYLNMYHGASYFRRWHGQRDQSGTLWVHKATHHFDLLNWWLNSDPAEVFAYGDLERYGRNNEFRGENCRKCNFQKKCDHYWDITKDQDKMNLYVNHEHHDGYYRDGCVYSKEIDIYDKMSAQIKYKNNVVVNYSLTTYSPYEGWRIAFNGTKGRLEASMDIPYHNEMRTDQKALHELEMDQSSAELTVEPIITHKLWDDFKIIQVGMEKTGHGGGDKRLHDQIFKHPEQKDPFERSAGIHDGAISILIGVAARKSIESGKPVKIDSLTDLKLQAKRN